MRKSGSGSVGGMAQPTRVKGASDPAASSSRVNLYGLGSATKGSSAIRPCNVSAIKKDPRPNNKASIFRCITELQEFLVSYNYPHPLTSKQLMQPSSTDFRNIFEFLVSFLKPNYKMGKNIEDIVPKLLTLYGYPFTIPKSHFQVIGVPQTWPTIVLALTWLRISIQASMLRDFDTVIFSRSENVIIREVRQKLLFDYTNESYDMFVKGIMRRSLKTISKDLTRKLRH